MGNFKYLWLVLRARSSRPRLLPTFGLAEPSMIRVKYSSRRRCRVELASCWRPRHEPLDNQGAERVVSAAARHGTRLTRERDRLHREVVLEAIADHLAGAPSPPSPHRPTATRDQTSAVLALPSIPGNTRSLAGILKRLPVGHSATRSELAVGGAAGVSARVLDGRIRKCPRRTSASPIMSPCLHHCRQDLFQIIVRVSPQSRISKASGSPWGVADRCRPGYYRTISCNS